MNKKTSELKEHKWNSSIFGNETLPEEFLDSIRSAGIRESLVIKDDGTVISGHKRLHAARELNIQQVPVRVVSYNSEIEEREAFIDYNRYREKTFSQRMTEAKFIEVTEGIKARERQAHGQTAPNKTLGSTLNKASKGRASDAVAKQTGIGGHTTYDKAKEVWGKAQDGEQNAKEQVSKIDKGETTINGAYTRLRREQKRKQTKDAPDLPDNKYRVLYADPPWKYSSPQHSKKEQVTTLDTHYPSMTISELCELPVADIAAENAVLFMWTTSPMLEECFVVIKAWGFKYKSSFIWDKIKHNVGHYNSVRHEFLLVCTKGSCTPDNLKLFDSVQSIEKTEHSRKPEEFREIIDTLYTGGRKLELFRRGDAPEGWEVWGNEIDD